MVGRLGKTLSKAKKKKDSYNKYLFWWDSKNWSCV
jgi:hypothetical protein